jgi:hypothetical protein
VGTLENVPRPKSANTLQVSLNVPEAWEAEIERLAEAMSEPGITITKSDVMRRAMRLGLDALAKKKGGRAG